MLKLRFFVLAALALMLVACVGGAPRLVIVTTTPRPTPFRPPTSTPQPTPQTEAIVPTMDELEPNCKRYMTNAEFRLTLGALETGTLRVMVRRGDSSNMQADHIGSLGSDTFGFCTFTPSGRLPGFDHFSMTWSGAFPAEQGTDIRIYAYENATPGVYGAWVALRDGDTGAVSEPFWLEVTIK